MLFTTVDISHTRQTYSTLDCLHKRFMNRKELQVIRHVTIFSGYGMKVQQSPLRDRWCVGVIYGTPRLWYSDPHDCLLSVLRNQFRLYRIVWPEDKVNDCSVFQSTITLRNENVRHIPR